MTEPTGGLPPARLLGIEHAQLAMPPGEQAERDAERFYEGVLGLPRVPKPAELAARGGCWFEGPTVRLHLGVEHDFRPAAKAHPALLVDDLDVVCQRIVDAGGEVRPADDLPGISRVHT
ncbi:MAG: VOC family protein, partial [Acidimicrobiales bacterium]